jgi:hypothetical protein
MMDELASAGVDLPRRDILKRPDRAENKKSDTS